MEAQKNTVVVIADCPVANTRFEAYIRAIPRADNGMIDSQIPVLPNLSLRQFTVYGLDELLREDLRMQKKSRVLC